MEVNHHKIQVTSLFTSIQQVETEIRKEQETTQQHNRDKALSKFKKSTIHETNAKLNKGAKTKNYTNTQLSNAKTN